MGDFLNLIENIQKDKERFSELVNKMDPLICKYMRILYKDEKEDVRSELVLALWEAVTKLKYAENEGQCVTYIVNALRNKFHELYRNSRKDHDNYFASEMTMLDTATFEEEEYGNLVVKNDLNKYLENIRDCVMKYTKQYCLKICQIMKLLRHMMSQDSMCIV